MNLDQYSSMISYNHVHVPPFRSQLPKQCTSQEIGLMTSGMSNGLHISYVQNYQKNIDVEVSKE